MKYQMAMTAAPSVTWSSVLLLAVLLVQISIDGLGWIDWQFLDSFPKKLAEYEDLLTKNDIYKKRTQGVGKLSKL